MEGLLNGGGDLNDDVRMLTGIGTKYIARSICLWGGEASLLQNFERARQKLPYVRAADPEMVLEACIFEIVTPEVEQIPVPLGRLLLLGCRWRSATSVMRQSYIHQLSGPARGDGTVASPI